MCNMIKFSGIEIKFGDFVAISSLDLEVHQGEFFTFLGPSGCGKTTTLRSLVGFIKPTKGKIEVNGQDITDQPIEKRGIGMVFQSYALFPTMTVEENIVFGLKEHKWPQDKISQRLKEVAAMVNLTDAQLKKNVSELSGGQQQRVAIARALALNPKIIVLDEPLSNLDAKLRKSLRTELKKIQSISGTTMIYVTHDQEEALTLSDRIAVFNNGCVEQVGTPREIYYHPNTEFVANFIGDTNKITEEILDRMEGTGKPLDRDKNIYVRVESVKTEASLEMQKECYRIEAVYDSEEFDGITIRRTYKVGEADIKSVTTNRDAKLTRGDKAVLYIHPDDFMEFARG